MIARVCGPAVLSTLITRDITKRLSAYEMAGAKVQSLENEVPF